jgi:hypothetical protein
MHLERSPPKTGPDVPYAQQADVPPNAFLLQQHDPKHGFSWASQLLNIRRCDNQMNPPGDVDLVCVFDWCALVESDRASLS